MDFTRHSHNSFTPNNSVRVAPAQNQRSNVSWAGHNNQPSNISTAHTYEHPLVERMVDPPSKRGQVEDTPTLFSIIVDVHDFNPEEISVQLVSNGTAAIVKGDHGKGSQNKDGKSNITLQNVVRSESRSFSERYTLPSDLDMGTFKWDFPDKSHLRIMIDKKDQPSAPKESIKSNNNIDNNNQRQERAQPKYIHQHRYSPNQFFYRNAPMLQYYGNNFNIPIPGGGYNRIVFPQRYGYGYDNYPHNHSKPLQ